MGVVDAVVGFYQIIDEEFHLFFVSGDKVFKGLEVGHFAGLWSELFAAAAAIVHRNIQNLAAVEERGIVPAVCLVLRLRFNASDWQPVTGIFQ